MVLSHSFKNLIDFFSSNEKSDSDGGRFFESRPTLTPLSLVWIGIVILEIQGIIVDDSTTPGCYGEEFLKL